MKPVKANRQRITLLVFAAGIITLTAWAWYQLIVVDQHPFSPILQWRQRGAPAELELQALFEEDNIITVTCGPNRETPVMVSLHKGSPEYETFLKLLAIRVHLVTDYETVRKWCRRAPVLTIDGNEVQCSALPFRCAKVEQHGRKSYYVRPAEVPCPLQAFCENLMTE